jgi:hypothetical protein
VRDARIGPSAEKDYAIIRAAGNGHRAVVELLMLYPRVNPAARDNLPVSKPLKMDMFL